LYVGILLDKNIFKQQLNKEYLPHCYKILFGSPFKQQTHVTNKTDSSDKYQLTIIKQL
jgi:hypothetical protein